MSKPRPVALDLCCGRGGWTGAFLSAGFEVVGVDIQRFKDYPAGAHFLWADLLALKKAIAESPNPRAVVREFRRLRVVVASPPCTQYSKLDQPGLFPNLGTQDVDVQLWEACAQIAILLQVPLVLENVRGAQKIHGTAEAHYGSFYLWGDGVPALLPKLPGRQGRPSLKWNHRSPSLRAKIPNELAQHIARYHMSLCVRRSAPTRVSTAVSTRVQQLATVCGTERLTEGLL
jgi:hypothetical protein